MIPLSKIELTIYSGPGIVEQKVSASMAYYLIEDLMAYHGVEVAKESWWMVYERLREQLEYD